MEEMLRSKLKDDETLLWSATPEAFDILDTTHKSHFVKKAIAIGVVFAALCAVYVYMAQVTHSKVQLLVLLVGLLAAAYGMFGEYLEGNKLRNKTVYGLTDQRMIAVMGMSVEAVDYERVSDFTFETDADGHTTLLCGERAREVKPHGRRSVTVCGAQNNADTGLCQGFAMYGITDHVDTIRGILADKIHA